MPAFGQTVAILRSFDEAKAREFYLDFLGFEVVFEHRFEDDMPLYMGIKRGDCELHISEHHGDATPGARTRIHVKNLVEYSKELWHAGYQNAKPGLPCPTPWGHLELTVTDPFGNKLTFWEESDG